MIPKMTARPVRVLFMAAVFALGPLTLWLLVDTLSPPGVRQSLSFREAQREAQLSAVKDWRSVHLEDVRVTFAVPEEARRQGNRWLLGDMDVFLGVRWRQLLPGDDERTLFPPQSTLLDESTLALGSTDASSFTIARAGGLEQHVVFIDPAGTA